MRARSATPAPFRVARDTGAQKCERDPGSENASEPNAAPLASSANNRGRPGGGAAATDMAALTCIR
ncbi:hypothetical protein [Actinophytocola sp.]|uniref:hypothetical protein n=1 Tax=Actinophytocola sp. TaxID=1872138 RepID=UPI0025B94B1B|nr:hypothetical protein [Actinophytocola sp.]